MFSDVFSTDKSRLKEFYKVYTEENVKEINDEFVNRTMGLNDTLLYKTYFNIIYKCSLLCNELGIIDPNMVCVLLEYLIWEGYLSKGKSMCYSFDRKLVHGLYGVNVIEGKGVCLNTASILTNILRYLGIEAYTVGCDLSSGKAYYYYKPDIKIQKDRTKNDRKFNKFFSKQGFSNHAVTLYKTDKGYMYSDLVNLLFLDNDKILKASFVGASKSVIIKPYLCLLEQIMSYETFIKLFEDVFDDSNRTYLDTEHMINFSENVMDICRKSKNLFDDFHDDIKGDIDVVCRELKKYN